MRTKMKREKAMGVRPRNDEPTVRRAPLGPEILKRLYYSMLKCRMADEQARRFVQEGKLTGTCNCESGPEALVAGATLELLPEDTVVPGRWYFPLGVVRGASLSLLYAQQLAHSRSPNPAALAAVATQPLNMISPALTMTAQLNVGTGVALAYRLQKRDNIVMAFSDSASSSPSPWHESVQFAAAQRLPIIFVLNSLNGTKDEATGQRIRSIAEPCGVPAIPVDGNDAIAVYRVCHEARVRARQGYGPTIVEAKAVCLRSSRTNGAGRSSRKPGTERMASDPICSLEQYLRRHELFEEEWRQQITTKIAREITESAAGGTNFSRS